MDISMDIFT